MTTDWYVRRRADWEADGTRFDNVGLWTDGTTSLAQAQRALAAHVLANVDARSTLVVDLACGPGGTTLALAASCPRAQVIGIDPALPAGIGTPDPRVRFLHGDARALPLLDASVDAITCIEAIQHIETRADVLAEAARVLKPGGTIHLTDVLIGARTPAWARLVPETNAGLAPTQYAALLLDAGFVSVGIENLRPVTWDAHATRVMARMPQAPPADALPVIAYIHAWARRA